MEEPVVVVAEAELSFWDQHRYMLLIGISIGIAIFLVFISMALYESSGAAQLDLSRPGYSSVTSQAVKNDGDFQTYPTSGALDKAALDQFKSLYDKQAAQAKAVDAFNGDPLSPDVLELSAPPSQ